MTRYMCRAHSDTDGLGTAFVNITVVRSMGERDCVRECKLHNVRKNNEYGRRYCVEWDCLGSLGSLGPVRSFQRRIRHSTLSRLSFINGSTCTTYLTSGVHCFSGLGRGKQRVRHVSFRCQAKTVMLAAQGRRPFY
jgi:hypothetical protein